MQLSWDFPGDPVSGLDLVLSLLGPGFNPWAGNYPTSHMVRPKRRKRKSVVVPRNTGQLRQAAKKDQVSPVTQVAGIQAWRSQATFSQQPECGGNLLARSWEPLPRFHHRQSQELAAG